MPERSANGAVRPGSPMSQLPLETARLLLRPYRQDDAAVVAGLLDDAVMAEYLIVIPQPFVIFDARTLIRAAWRRLTTGRGFDLAIILRGDTDRLIGSVGLALADDRKGGELGFWIGRDWWGQGYASEATARMVGFAVEVLGLERMTATALVGNAASARVLTKLGFVESGRAAKEVPSSGERRETVLFALDAGASGGAST